MVREPEDAFAVENRVAGVKGVAVLALREKFRGRELDGLFGVRVEPPRDQVERAALLVFARAVEVEGGVDEGEVEAARGLAALPVVDRAGRARVQVGRAAVAVGQVWDCTLVMMEPTPWDIIIVPSVAMNGGSRSLATSRPLARPNVAPTATVSSSASASGHWCCLNTNAPSSAEHIMTVPIERSMPPVMMTNVTPKAMKPM